MKAIRTMKTTQPEYNHIEGKTYTLFGNSDSTGEYYETIRELADRVSEMRSDTGELLGMLKRFSARKRSLRRALENKREGNLMDEILNLIDPYLKKYTSSTEEHLKHIALSKLWDRRIATTREQYHLYMLEVELTNRLFIMEFRRAERKIALLPYCLQDFTIECRSEKSGFDYQCRHCSVGCFQNHSSNILKANNIEAYIWQGGNMKQLAKETMKEKKRFAVLGIACIPELINGMRTCRKNGIPVVGLPLNANRCIRWFGKFFPNSVDLTELRRLVEE
jgi:hypothetical protein